MALPRVNKAYVYEKHGNPADVLILKDDLPIPTLSPTQVLVEVKASGFNPVSYKTMTTFPSFMVKKPCIPENDVSGIVVGTGANADVFQKGDEVLGIIPAEVQHKTGFGTLAKYAIVESSVLIKKPANISFEQAACLPLTGMTAWESLQRGKIQKGNRVFVNGGSGGVGVMGVQIAKTIVGETGIVVASCSAANESLVRSLGADDVLDYRKEDLAKQLAEKYPAAEGKGFDIFFDTIGIQNLFDKSPSFLNEKGTFVNVGAADAESFAGLARTGGNLIMNKFLPVALGGTPRKYEFLLMKSTQEHLFNVVRLASEGHIKPVIDNSYNFSDALEAYKRMMSGRAVGKVLLKSEN